MKMLDKGASLTKQEEPLGKSGIRETGGQKLREMEGRHEKKGGNKKREPTVRLFRDILLLQTVFRRVSSLDFFV